ncbi:MAG: hypothetical protein IJN88_06440 [Clostridia bacterium]|nr:hypothetical protein [Clostridia bacterium]
MSKLYGGLSALKDGTFTFDEVLVLYTEMPLSAFVFETMINKKKEGKNMARIMNQASVDLRSFTPEALKKIKSITNVHLIMLPENPTPEFTEAYTSIQKTNVMTEINISGNASVFNGMTILTKDDLAKDSLVVCNGFTVLRDIPAEMNIRVIINGSLIKSPDVFVEAVKINGTVYKIYNDANIIRSVAEINFDRNFINNLKEKTVIVACGKIYISDEVTEEMLSEKQVKFISVGKIFARRELHGYIQANSDAVGKVLTAEEKNQEKKKLFRWK